MKLKKLFAVAALALAVLLAATSCSLIHEHTFSEWQIVYQPNCTSFGLQSRVCECGHTEYKTDDAFGHTVVTESAVAPTCTTLGKTEGSYCSTCGVIISAQSAIAPTGHSYDEIIVLEEALCNQNGTKRYSCTNADCDSYYDESYSLQSLDTAAIYDAAAQYTGRLIALGNLGHFVDESSAFVISADGKILTSAYPIDNAYSAIFILGDNYYDVTEVLAYDHETDIAVLKIDATDLPYAKFSESEPVNGETVYSVGTPAGLPVSISIGAISNANREIDGFSFIQHDADMTSSYLGGPLLNRLGEVIGVNTCYYGDEIEDINIVTRVSDIEALDYSNPISMQEYGALTYTPVEQINVWVKNYATIQGTNNTIAYVIQGKGFYYALCYDNESEVSFLEGYWELSSGYKICVQIILNNSDGTYEYHALFTDGAKQNEVVGYIDAATYDKSTDLTYDTYYGKYWTESEVMAFYRVLTYNTLEFFSYCLDTYFDTLTLETFGFTSLSYERDEEALTKLENFIMTNGAYEELTGSYVLSGSSQMGEDTMQFNLAYHTETGNTVVSVHYYLANGGIYSAYLTLNPTEDGHRFDFMYATNGEDGYKIHNTAWGYLDAATLTSQTKLTCYEFNGMNEYEDLFLIDYSMFLDYIMGLINYSVMPSVDPALTVADLGFYFYFGGII